MGTNKELIEQQQTLLLPYPIWWPVAYIQLAAIAISARYLELQLLEKKTQSWIKCVPLRVICHYSLGPSSQHIPHSPSKAERLDTACSDHTEPSRPDSVLAAFNQSR